MRGLKYIAVFFVILLLTALLLVGYFFFTANVSIVAYGAKEVPCAETSEEFEKIKKSLEEETFIGTRFSYEPLGSVEEYSLLTYTVRLSNQCFVPIDMIEIQIVPDPTDYLQIGNTEVHSLAPKTQGEFQATIMCRANSHKVRELVLTYYVWGASFSIKETYRGK